MNRITAIAIYAALTVWPGVFAHAQPVLTPDAKPYQTHRAGEPVICCTHHDAGSRAEQAYSVPQPDGGMHLGSVVTRLEIECVLSGKCDAAERRRVSY